MSDTLSAAEPQFSWNSPLLIAGVLLLTFVLGGVTFLFLTRAGQQPQEPQQGFISRAVGTPIDPVKTQDVVEQVLGQENRFLSFSIIRNTYAGLIGAVNQLEAVEPTDNALEIVITNGAENESFFLTKQVLEEKSRFYLFDNRQQPPIMTEISYSDLQPEWGVSITMVNDLMEGEDYISEVIVEATAVTTAQ